MSAAAVSPDPAALSAVAADVLASLHRHRLLSARQLHELHAPRARPRWMQRVLAGLTERGLVQFVRAGRGAPRLYFLTARGAAELAPAERWAAARRALIAPEQAAGPLRAHTLAVNDVGIAFVRAAREHGDEFGPLGWRHEVALPIAASRRGRRPELVIADAALTYLVHGERGERTFHYRLLELDRGTLPVDELGAKLARYARAYRHTAKGGGGGSRAAAAWNERFPVFPGILCVLADRPGRSAARRRETLIALCRADDALARTPQVKVSVCLLDELTAAGPFAPIFRRPAQPGQAVDWLGRPAATSGDVRGGR